MFDQIRKSTEFMKHALGGYSLRQQAISTNVANADTPGYQRREVAFESQLQAKIERAKQPSGWMPVAMTDPRHIPLTLDDLPFVPTTQVMRDTTLRRDGNNVDIDLEMARLAQNEISYNAVSQFLGGRIGSLKYVISDGGAT